MTDLINRYERSGSSMRSTADGGYVLFYDHLGAREADKAEIERLRALVAECWQAANDGAREAHESDDELPGIITTHRLARERMRARIAELESHVSVTEKLYEAAVSNYNAILERAVDAEAGQDEAVRRDAGRLRQFELWANDGLCPHLVFNDNGWWAVSFDGGGPASLDDPPPSGAFTACVEAEQWRQRPGEAIDAAIAAAKEAK